MKLKLEFVTKAPKVAKDNEIILLKDKKNKNKILKSLNKSLFTNKLFQERKFLTKYLDDKNYIFVNCMKSKTSLDYEKLGSDLYLFLKNNKIENAFLDANTSFIRITSLSLAAFGAFVTNSNFSFIFLKYLIDIVVYLINY